MIYYYETFRDPKLNKQFCDHASGHIFLCHVYLIFYFSYANNINIKKSVFF